MSSIHNFKQGDIITRVEPSKNGDRSYMGDKMIFIGIANAQIYYENPESITARITGTIMSKVALDQWSEGWELYVNPMTLFKKVTLTGDAII
jgi:hypothetical protein